MATVPFEIRDGDRVLFLGDTLLEREGTYGYLETRLDRQFADRRFTVRNLSWSGDTPLGVSRASFDPPAAGWARLKEQIGMVRPTVVFLGFGMAATLQEITDRSGDIMLNPDVVRYGREPMTAERFKGELAQLMDAIDENAKSTGGSVRYVLLSPIAHEDLRGLRPGLPDPAAHNALIQAYSAKIQELAKERGGRFVSLFRSAPKVIPAKDAGPDRIAYLTTNGIHPSPDGYADLAESIAKRLGWDATTRQESVSERAALQAAIVRKNQLFFHRWRPENYTYLFGFRKHEQGQNAKEIPEFDPLIAQVEAEIEQVKKGSTKAEPVRPPKAPETAKAGAPAAPAAPTAPAAPEVLPDFTVQDGFDIQLWATNPLLEKPIQMNWDADGRLWIASSSTYPQVNPEDVAAMLAGDIARKGDAPSTGNDRIIIVEDPDHTGKATKSTVFAEGLLIPTAVAPFHNSQGQWGCYVGQSTELLELTDTKGEGRADQRRIILSGFGTEDTHHLVHTLKWGPDGRLYFNQSIYIHTHMETPWGMVRLNSGGTWAWDPRTERVEVLFKGFCNPWGHVWDKAGQSFLTDGAGFQGVTWGIPGAMYFTYENGRKICPSISPGTYPKFASLEMIDSPHFPTDWQGSFITNDFRAHRVVHFGLNDLSASSGATAQSGYITKELPDLVRTSDLSFRPIDVRLGPDGALYIADWSNPVINHGEVDFRDPRRDHHQGRIWKVTHKGTPLLPWDKLSSKSAAELKAKIESANAWEQQQAKRVLAEGGASFAAPVRARLLADQLTRPTVAKPAVDAATRQADVSELAELIKDKNPRTRVEAMRALARLQDARSAELVLENALNGPADDQYYQYAVWLSINDLAEPWSQAVLKGEWKINSPERERQLELALSSIDPVYGAAVLAKVLEGREIPADGSGPWLELIGKSGGPDALRRVFDALLGQKLNPAASDRAIDAMLEAARLRGARPSGNIAGVEALLAPGNAHVAAKAAHLVGAWKTPHAIPLLHELASGGVPAVSQELRVAAVDGLREVGGREVVGILRELAEKQPGPGVSRVAAVSLASLDLGGSWPQIVALLNALPEDKQRLDTWRAILSNKGAAGQIAGAISKKSSAVALTQPAAASGLRVAREQGRNGAALADALRPLAGAGSAPAQPQRDFSTLVEFTKRDGDPSRGEEIYRRAELVCTTCHAIGGAGGKVGPELTSLGASAPLDYIIESVLVPQAKVKEGFNAVTLTLKDGTAVTGIQSHETAQEVFLRTATGQESPVVKSNIVSRENVGSIMPAGLTDQLKDRERIDLYAFLSQLGKPGPYDASKGVVARYWALYPGSEAAKVLAGHPPEMAGPGYTLVDGRLTRSLLESALQFVPNAGTRVLAAARFQLPTAGRASLHLIGASKATLDGKPIELRAAGDAQPELAAGEHTLVVELDPQHLPEVLRVEAPEARFLGN